MCVPCAAAAPELLPIIIFILALIGGLIVGVFQAIPKVATVIAFITMGLWRWLSGAVLRKDLGTSDAKHYAETRTAPNFSRPVRAAARISLVALIIAAFVNPVGTALIGGSLVVSLAGISIYGKRRAGTELARREDKVVSR